jgi:hypothetical protein
MLLSQSGTNLLRAWGAQGMGGPELMREYNRLYEELADECQKNNLLLDHNGLPDNRVSVEKSKEHRITAVDSRTRKTCILRRFEDMVCKVHNELLPILDKKVLVDGKIPSGRQAEECMEEQPRFSNMKSNTPVFVFMFENLSFRLRQAL